MDYLEAVVAWIAARGDLMTALTGVLALVVATRSVPAVSRWSAARRIAWQRRRQIGPATRSSGAASRVPRRVELSRSHWVFAGVDLTPAEEIDWLSGQLGLEHALTFDTRISAEDRVAIAAAYGRLSGRLLVRTLLGGNQPALEREARLARQVSDLVLACAGRADQAEPADETAICSGRGGFRVELSSLRRPPEPRDADLRPRVSTDLRPSRELRIAVSWARRRLQLDLGGGADPRPLDAGHRVELIAVDDEARRLAVEKAAEPHWYDGVLPRLLDWRFEKDMSNGADVLHLSLGELSYQAHTTLSRPGQSQPKPGTSCLTLSLIAVTTDDKIVAVRRARTDTYYPGRWAATVNGNLEMPTGLHPSEDADEWGLPDPIQAILREGREELALEIPHAAVVVDGLARVESSSEVGTHVLCCTAFVNLTAAQVCWQARFADRVLGAWETHGDVLPIPLPRDRAGALALARWLWQDDQVMPHLAATITHLLCNLGLLDPTARATWTTGVFERPADVMSMGAAPREERVTSPPGPRWSARFARWKQAT